MLTMQDLPLLGAGAFGAIIGWFVYYVNRYRKSEIQFSDIVTLVGAIGGAAVLSLFPRESELFGAYGVGLFIGFFGYFIVLVSLVRVSPNFNADFFLDGRRKRPARDEYIPGSGEPGGDTHPMLMPAAAAERQTFVVIPPNAIQIAADALRSESSEAETSSASVVTAACKAEWPGSQADCGNFVRGVASRLAVSLAGNADSILSQIQGVGWEQHGNDGVAASRAAAAGKLVIAGLTSKELGDDHGHVVVVVPPTGPLAHGKYPFAYWGSLNEVIRPNGGKGTTINYSFNKSARDQVHYSSREI